MASPTRFLSGRQQEQKIGIEGSTGNQKVLEVVGQVGIGTTIFETKAELDVRGNAIVSGILTVSSIVITSGAGGVFEVEKLKVSGISTFVGISTFENNLFVGEDLDVDGHTELDNVNVSGASTFTGIIDANGDLDVDGHTELDNVNVSGVSTFVGISTFENNLFVGEDLDVDGHTELDNVNVSGISTFVGISTFENNLFVGEDLDVDGHTELDSLNVSIAATTASLTLSNIGVAVTAILDEDGLASDRDDALATQQSIKSYVDAQVTAQDIDFAGDTGTGSVDLDSETLTIAGTTNEIETVGSGNTLTVGLPNVVAITTSLTVGSATTITGSGIVAGIVTGTLDNNLTLATSGTGLSGSATYNNSGTSTFTVTSDATDANTASTIVSRDGSGDFSAGTISADLTGVASTATKLGTSRNFSISGDFVTASSVSFDGTGDVSLGATITTNSITLGTYTTGDYVSSISGTSNEIAVSSGTGEGSTPTISFVTNPTIGGNVTIGNDLQVNNNLNVTGNITVGGTSATVFTETLRVKDADIVLGFTTNSSGNEVSTDTTANNGGIAIASTEGSPIVSFNIDSIPSTYKNIMWFKTNAFTGLNTDAWLTNYSFGVGTTSMSAGTKFAVGNIEADFDDITSVRHIKSSGIITASSFSGDGSGLTGVSGGTSLDSNETTNQSQLIPFYVSTGTTDVAGVSTQSFVFNPSTKSLGIGTGAPTSNLHVEGNVNITGVSTFTGAVDINADLDVVGHTELDDLNVSGLSTFSSAVDINADLDVDGHTELDNLNVSGVSTFSDDVRFVGAANTDVVWDKSANSLNFEDYAKATFGDGGDLTITHSSNQSSISESSGSGLEVKSVKVTITPNGSTEKMAEFNANSSVDLYFDDSKKLETTGYGITITGDVNTSNNISIAGVSTFASAVDINADLDVNGYTELDDVKVSGLSTFSSAVDINADLDVDGHTELDNLNVSGLSTFSSAVDINADLDVVGHTELDDLNVSGLSTFSSAVDINADLDVDGHTELDNLNVSGVSTFASAVVGSVGSAVTISSSGINAATGIITASSLDAAICEWVLGADGISNYTFTGPGLTGAENDPSIYLVRGQKYNFKNEMGAHPFRIQSNVNGIAGTGVTYNDGITNNKVQNGTLVWDVQFDAPERLYYQCESHDDMGGTIYIGNGESIIASSVIVGSAVTISSSGINNSSNLNVSGVSTFSSAVNTTDIIKGYKYTAVPYGSTVTLAVTVASKDATHRYNGTGSGNGYVIDGIQAPFLTLTPGRTYRFTNENTGSHPLKFYLEADKTTLYETNVDFQNTYTEIIVTDETPIVLHYQCTAHGYMGNAIQTNSNVVNTNYDAILGAGLTVVGVSTFASAVDINANLDVDGFTELDGVNVSETLKVSGLSTFTSAVDINNNLDVDGFTELDGVNVSETLNVSGLSTFSSAVDINADLDVDGFTELDGVNVSETLNVSGLSTFASAVDINAGLDVDGHTELDGVNSSGIITAVSYRGDGSQLTGIAGDGQFDEEITDRLHYAPTSSEATALTFPSTAGKAYIIESIRVANVDTSVGVGTTVRIVVSLNDTYIAYHLPIPNGGSLELIEQAMIAKPSNFIKMWSSSDTRVGLSNATNVYITYSAKDDPDNKFFSEKSAGISTIPTSIKTLSANATLESIHISNRSDTGDYPVTVSIVTGTTTSHIVKDLIIPKYGAVELLDRPALVLSGDIIKVSAGTTDTLDVILSGKTHT